MSRYSNATRVEEDSRLLVKWVDSNGQPWAEQTETRDISETGVSFYLKSPIWVDTHLRLTIASSDLFGRLHKTKGKVVRIQADAQGRQLVAVRFDE